MKLLKDWRKIDVNGEPVLQHVNLLNQKTTADDDDISMTHICSVFNHDGTIASIGVMKLIKLNKYGVDN